MKIENETKLSFNDVLIKPRSSSLNSRKDVNLTRNFTFKHSKKKWTGIPIIVANMATTGTFEMVASMARHNILTCLHKHYSFDQWEKFLYKSTAFQIRNIAVTIGIREEEMQRLEKILNFEPGINFICLDVANGYTTNFVSRVKSVRQKYPGKIIIAGNVVTPEMTKELIDAGADIVKIGIGSGSACLTRVKTGVGYPQLSAVIECSKIAHECGAHIISDGGCNKAGDFCKAFGAGSDFVMAGGIFAGHDECSGEVEIKDGKKYKIFYGMSSELAMTKHGSGKSSYKSSEGKVVLAPYKGYVLNTILDILGGIRSCCTYVGAHNLEQLYLKTTFIKTSIQENKIFGL